MNRAIVAAIFLAWSLVAVARADHQPNLIFFLSDDQGVEAIEGPAWPNGLNCHTPNLANLASQGRSFVNTRVNPYCSPTRAAILTGRQAFSTGVTGVVNQGHQRADRDRLSLQTHERTIADVLQEQGYYTIFVDKWHTGWNPDLGLMPEQQGFDVSFLWPDYIHLDDPLLTGDEHLSRMMDLAIEAVLNRPDPDQPYALFFWSIDAHARTDPQQRERMRWWRVDESLLPSGEDYYSAGVDSERNRYRAIIEAIDTEVGRLLRTLEVIDEDGDYRNSSDTVFFYLSDNGTPREVSLLGDRAKGSLYEGGILVPFIAFGEDVPDDGAVLDRLISHVDFFETIADIADASRNDRGDAPRSGMSFADAIGWEDDFLPRREYSLSSLGHDAGPAQHRVALTDGRFKLIARAGGLGLAPLSGDEFYDLLHDPGEISNLVSGGMNDEQKAAYRRMRNRVSSLWPSAVGEPTVEHIDLMPEVSVSIGSDNSKRQDAFVIGHRFDASPDVEHRTLLRFDLSELDDRLPPGTSINDVVGAQLVLVFQADAAGSANSDTGPIRAYRVTDHWEVNNANWNRLRRSFDDDDTLGLLDLPPYVVVNPTDPRLDGIPLPLGTPVSLGQDDDLLDLVLDWYDDPWDNNGVVLMAEPLDDLEGNQSANFLRIAALRLTVDLND